LLRQSSGTFSRSKTIGAGHYLFAWTAMQLAKGNDFLAVIDADLLRSVWTPRDNRRDGPTDDVRASHGIHDARQWHALCHDHEAGRSFIFDVRDPLHPKGRIRLLMRADTCIRTPISVCRTGTCLLRSSTRTTTSITESNPATTTGGQHSGGLVEIDERGQGHSAPAAMRTRPFQMPC